MDFIRNVYILSKLDQKPVLDFHWILYWIIGGFLLNIKSTRFYVKSTRFPHLANYSNNSYSLLLLLYLYMKGVGNFSEITSKLSFRENEFKVLGVVRSIGG